MQGVAWVGSDFEVLSLCVLDLLVVHGRAGVLAGEDRSMGEAAGYVDGCLWGAGRRQAHLLASLLMPDFWTPLLNHMWMNRMAQ